MKTDIKKESTVILGLEEKIKERIIKDENIIEVQFSTAKSGKGLNVFLEPCIVLTVGNETKQFEVLLTESRVNDLSELFKTL